MTFFEPAILWQQGEVSEMTVGKSAAGSVERPQIITGTEHQAPCLFST